MNILGVDIWYRDHRSFAQPCQAPTADVSKLVFVSLGENRFNYSVVCDSDAKCIRSINDLVIFE